MFTIKELSFPNECFERVIMVDAFRHNCNQSETADELWRILQLGGRIVIEEPDVRTYTVKLIAMGEKLVLIQSHFLSQPRIAELFSYSNAHVRVETGRYMPGSTTCHLHSHWSG